MDQFLEIAAFDAVLAGEFLESGLGGDDDGDGFLLVGVGVAADVRDDGGGAVDGFKLCERLLALCAKNRI